MPGDPGAHPARQASLRRHNLGLVLRALVEAAPVTRAELARRTSLTKATISGFVEILVAAGVAAAHPVAPAPPAPGRPGSPVGLARCSPVALGCEIGVDFASACVVDLAGAVRARARLALDNRRGDPGARLARVARLVADVAADAKAAGAGRVVGLGVAVPGVVGPDGRTRTAPNLPRWQGREVGTELAARLGDPGTASGGQGFVVEVANEANLAALAEMWHGSLPGRGDFALVSAEVGIGAGIVVGGRLYSGSSGAAGELGHLTVDPDGPTCGCGARGCLERFAGQEVLLQAAGQPDRAALGRAAAAGEPATLAALERAGRALGVAAAALVNVVDVPTLVLGGLYAELAPYLGGTIEGELASRAVRHRWEPVRLCVSSLGDDAAMRGAAGVVVERVLADPLAHLPELAGPVVVPG